MSSAVKAVIWIIVLAAIAGAIYWFIGSGVPVGVPTGEGATAPSAELPTGAATDDTSLDLDLGAIDAQLDSFDADNASIDQGLADEPVEQLAL